MDIVTEKLSGGKGLDVRILNSSIVLSCTVTLRLGESRDVVLGLNDISRYFRKNNNFGFADREFSDCNCKDDTLILRYPSDDYHEPPILFNLKGHGVGDIEDHNLTLYSDHFLWDGHSCHVAGTPMDFREETTIGERIRMGYDPLIEMGGYDHVFLLDDAEDGLKHAATLMDRMRTLKMDVFTTFPAIYVYTGNSMNGRDIGKGGCIYPRRGGIALMPCDPAFGEDNKNSGEVYYSFTALNR